jgi:hypothetical protein
MAEGLTVIAAGLVVVLGIMASMFVLIEVILELDRRLGILRTAGELDERRRVTTRRG